MAPMRLLRRCLSHLHSLRVWRRRAKKKHSQKEARALAIDEREYGPEHREVAITLTIHHKKCLHAGSCNLVRAGCPGRRKESGGKVKRFVVAAHHNKLDPYHEEVNALSLMRTAPNSMLLLLMFLLLLLLPTLRAYASKAHESKKRKKKQWRADHENGNESNSKTPHADLRTCGLADLQTCGLAEHLRPPPASPFQQPANH